MSVMMKTSTFWLRAASIVGLLFAACHLADQS
jgi:hypothetical protein